MVLILWLSPLSPPSFRSVGRVHTGSCSRRGLYCVGLGVPTAPMSGHGMPCTVSRSRHAWSGSWSVACRTNALIMKPAVLKQWFDSLALSESNVTTHLTQVDSATVVLILWLIRQPMSPLSFIISFLAAHQPGVNAVHAWPLWVLSLPCAGTRSRPSSA